jgi:hypothetical protein
VDPIEQDVERILKAANEQRSRQMPGFPELSPEQRKFAVHPGFKSYYDSSFRSEEGIEGDKKHFFQ